MRMRDNLRAGTPPVFTGGVPVFFKEEDAAGFAHIAVQFYSETGKKAIFYPIFADKKRRAYTIGEGIPFEPGKPAAEEKRRIAGALHDAMEEMIGENTED